MYQHILKSGDFIEFTQSDWVGGGLDSYYTAGSICEVGKDINYHQATIALWKKIAHRIARKSTAAAQVIPRANTAAAHNISLFVQAAIGLAVAYIFIAFTFAMAPEENSRRLPLASQAEITLGNALSDTGNFDLLPKVRILAREGN